MNAHPESKRITVIHHSGSGGTRALVAAFSHGAQSCAEVSIFTRSAEVCQTEDLVSSDLLVFASPENFGYMAGGMKAMFDRLFYSCMADTTVEGGGTQSRLAGKPYALLVCAGNDGSGAALSMQRIITGWRMVEAQPPLLARRVGGEAGSAKGQLSEADIARARELGELLANGLALGML